MPLEIGSLPRLFGSDPIRPGFSQALAVNVLELGGEVTARARVAAHPVDELIDPLLAGHVRDEARPVEIGVGARLEIDGGAFRLQPDRIVDMGAIAHLGAEHHLVVAGQSPAQSAAHPGLHENGHPLVIPAWRVVARVRQVAISDGDRVVGKWG